MSYKAPYKMVPCRYFDHYGRSSKPTCNQGDRCRFIHPNDPEWQGFRATSPSGHRIGPRQTGIHYARPKPKALSGTGPPKTISLAGHHSSGLVSQTDLFQQCKVDGKEDTPPQNGEKLLYRDRRQLPNCDYGGLSRSGNVSPKATSRPYESRSYLGVRRPQTRLEPDGRRKAKASLWEAIDKTENIQPNETNHRSEHGAPKGVPTIGDMTSATVPNVSGEVLTKPSDLSALPVQTTQEQQRVDKLVGLFRHLAQLSNQAIQDAATHERNEKKVETYTELSSTLSTISPTAATTVTGSLASAMLSHTQSKERVENTFKALGGLWENLFDLFAAEVVKVIDARQEDALTMMRGQGESIIKDILASSGGLVKQKPSITNSVESSVKNKSRKEGERGRSRDLVQQNPANASYDSGHGDSRGNKRRRLASHTTCDAGTSGQPQPPMLGDIVLDERVKDILEEMKSKIDRQARSLEYLTKENKLLQTTLRTKQSNTLLSPSCSSPGVSLSHHHTPGKFEADTRPVESW